MITKEEYLKLAFAVEKLTSLIHDNQIVTAGVWNEAQEIYNEAEIITFAEEIETIETQTPINILLKQKRDLQIKIKKIQPLLLKLRDDPSLWKLGRAGGQDSYAGLPPAMRIIDVIIKEMEQP